MECRQYLFIKTTAIATNAINHDWHHVVKLACVICIVLSRLKKSLLFHISITLVANVNEFSPIC